MLIVATLLWAATCLHQGFHAFTRAAGAAVEWIAAGWRRWASSLSPESVERFEAAVLWFRLVADLVTATGSGGLLVTVVTAVAAGLSVACALIHKARR
ncbi:hypothetical protein BJF84_15980 [Rhodococcus sp. CUA-806]|jgi:hypothetical protein|nr:hypothetical protein BJF84_15980 [Rhodococcus sp. CUA-806]